MEIKNTLILSILLSLSCHQQKNRPAEILVAKNVIDTNYIISRTNLIKKQYDEHNALDIFRLYQDSVPMDIFSFDERGILKQYVFLNERYNEPRFILNYDSIGHIVNTNGKSIYFSSQIFGKEIKVNSPYSVHIFGATPPQMKMSLALFYSPGNDVWNLYAEDELYDTLNSITLQDTASFERRKFMLIGTLRDKDNNNMVAKADTIFYQLNIKQ